MDELEQKLAEMRLAAPSEELDRRIDETFRAARNVGRGTRQIGFWWWLAGTTTAGGVAALLVFTSLPSSRMKPVPVVYRIEAQGRLREMLLNASTNQVEPTHFEVRVNEH